MEVKTSVICSTNAIIDPGTVVVVAFDASVANVTVSTLRQAYYFAERAEAFSVKGLKQLYEADLPATFDIACFRFPNQAKDNQIYNQ